MELKPIELVPKPENREDLGKRMDTLEEKANEVIRFINDRIEENSGGPTPLPAPLNELEKIEKEKTTELKPGDIESSPEEAKGEGEDLLNL
jgi:hypothetical protein